MSYLLQKASQLDYELATLIKMISFYEEKLQTLKYAIWDDSTKNLELSYELLTRGGEARFPALLELFTNNLIAINRNDVQLLIDIIGDGNTISLNEYLLMFGGSYKHYITQLHADIWKRRPDSFPSQSRKELQNKLLKLFQLQVKASRQQNAKKQFILSKYSPDMRQVFELMSLPEHVLEEGSIQGLMDRTDYEFSSLDYKYFVYHLFHEHRLTISQDQLFHCTFLNPVADLQRPKEILRPVDKTRPRSYTNGNRTPLPVSSNYEFYLGQINANNKPERSVQPSKYVVPQAVPQPQPYLKLPAKPFQQAFFSEPAQEALYRPSINVIPPQTKPIFGQYQPPSIQRSRVLSVETQLTPTNKFQDRSSRGTSVDPNSSNIVPPKPKSRHYSVSK